MDLADEMRLYWPVGARVVDHQGYQDFTGTITGHGDDGLTITGDGTTGDGVMVLPWGVVVLIAAAGYANCDPRSTRRYDRARGRLDRHASYALATHLG